METPESRRWVASGSPYEAVVGMARAVRVGDFIAVTGTAPINEDGSVAAPGDPAGQARRCFEIIEAALLQLDARMVDVVRTRILLTEIDHWNEVARVHGSVFADIRPASTIVEVSRFIDPGWLIEVEVDAIVTSSTERAREHA